jgi:hypothetical protein
MSLEYGAPPQPKSGMPVWAWFVNIPCGYAFNSVMRTT